VGDGTHEPSLPWAAESNGSGLAGGGFEQGLAEVEFAGGQVPSSVEDRIGVAASGKQDLAVAHQQDPATFSLILTQGPPAMIQEPLREFGVPEGDYRIMRRLLYTCDAADGPPRGVRGGSL